MATCSLPAAATDELPTVAEEWCGAKELVQSGLASFPIDARLLVALELALREGLVGGHWSSLRRSMSEDHDAVLHTPSASGEAELRWGCTKSGVTADNMCYVWAEDEPTMVGSIDLAKQALAGTARDRAYVIVIAGPNVGEMFKVADKNGDGEVDMGRAGKVTPLCLCSHTPCCLLA